LLRLLKSRIFILTLITIILLVVIGVTSFPDSGLNAVRNIFSVPLAPIQKFLTLAGQKISGSIQYFRDFNELIIENEELKQRVKLLENENRELQGFEEKNEQLREALNLKGRFDEYEITGGNVIARDPGNWFDIFTIDRGTRDGIRNNDPVVSASKGLVGRVDYAGLTSSKIVSVIDENSVISAFIPGAEGGHVRVRGDLELKEDGCCRMDYIPFDVNVEVGDVIETSGLGGIYPRGIVIGKVIEIRRTSSDMSRYAVIEPEVNFKRLDEVYVLKNKNIMDGDMEE
jgi:rod shape-determining protein MreC